MKRRICTDVIKQMIEVIPASEIDLISDLQWNYEDASFKAPEETLQWRRTSATLQKHILELTQDWQFNVLSIFSNIPADEIKNQIAADKKLKEAKETLQTYVIEKRHEVDFYPNLKEEPNYISGKKLPKKRKKNKMKAKEKKVTNKQVDAYVLKMMQEDPVKFVQYCLLIIAKDIHASGAEEFTFSSECNVNKENRVKVTVSGKIEPINNL